MIYEKESTQDILRGNQGIKLNKGLRTQGRINNTLLLKMDLLMLRIWKYLISTMRGTLYPLSGTLWKILERQYWRLCFTNGGTRSCSGLVTEGYLWMSILIYFRWWFIPWTSKNIMSPDSTLVKSCVENDDFNYLWRLLSSFVLEDNGVFIAKESTQPPKMIKVKYVSNMV